jgi:hypothetical protein
VPAIYRAIFDDGGEEIVKAEDFEQALHLARQTWLEQQIVSFQLVSVNQGQGPARAIHIDAQGNPKPRAAGQAKEAAAKGKA